MDCALIQEAPMKQESGPMRHSAEMTSVFFSSPALSPQGSSSVQSPESNTVDMETPVDLSQLGPSSGSTDMDLNEFLLTLQKN